MDIQIDFKESKIWMIIGEKKTEIKWEKTLVELFDNFFPNRRLEKRTSDGILSI